MLQNLIEVQGASTERRLGGGCANNIHPEKFFKDFVGFKLEELRRMFKWEDTRVGLVATIPGEYEGRLGGRMDEYEKQGEIGFLCLSPPSPPPTHPTFPTY